MNFQIQRERINRRDKKGWDSEDFGIEGILGRRKTRNKTRQSGAINQSRTNSNLALVWVKKPKRN
jgi:hypothetical protein